MTEQIKAMQKLGMTDTEIAEVLADDEKIDKGEKLFELPKELQEGAKKARMIGTKKPTVYNFTKREKKADNDKRLLLDVLYCSILDLVVDAKVNNHEREFEFKYKDKKYKIVLSCPRS